MPPHASGCAAPCHVPLGEPQSDAWVGELERRPEVVTCRGKWLAAVTVLPRLGTCRSPGLAGTRGALRRAFLRCLGWPPRQAPLAGVFVLQLIVPASSSCRGLVSSAWQAPLAGALSSWLKYFVLEWTKNGTMEGFGVPLDSPAAGCCDCPCKGSGY